MAEQSGPFIRSKKDADFVAQIGMLRGAALGALLTLPVACAVGLVGEWLGPTPDDLGDHWILAVTVLVTGIFIAAFWMGQRDLMHDWPKACRALVWAEWHRGLALFVPIGLPFAAAIGWFAWHTSDGALSLALGVGLECCWLFAGIGALVGYYRGERSVRQFLLEAGYARFGWFQYGAPDPGQTNVTDRLPTAQEIRAGKAQGEGGLDRDHITLL